MAGGIEVFLYTPPLDPKKKNWGSGQYIFMDPNPIKYFLCVWGVAGQYFYRPPPPSKYLCEFIWHFGI